MCFVFFFKRKLSVRLQSDLNGVFIRKVNWTYKKTPEVCMQKGKTMKGHSEKIDICKEGRGLRRNQTFDTLILTL